MRGWLEATALSGARQRANEKKDTLGAIEAVRDWTAPREELLAMLCEHEVMHEGQIIRHVYALQKSLPASWKWA